MRTRRLLAALALAVLVGSDLYGGVSMDLEVKSKYALPLEHRFEPSWTPPERAMILQFNKINSVIVAEVHFDQGYVVLTEWVNGYPVYEPRVIPIDEFQLFLENQTFIRLVSEVHKKQREKRGPAAVHFEIPVDIGKAWTSVVGEGGIGLDVSGMRRIELAGRTDYQVGEHTSHFPQLHMEQVSNFMITGSIGSKIKVKVDQDSQRSRELQNTINIKYTGEEDDVVRLVEAGNTTIGLRGATFVGYSERVQGLFGLKSQFRIGDLELTAIASQEQGENEHKTTSLGTQSQSRNINDYEYKQNTYFFIGNTFRDGTFSEGDSVINLVLYTSDVPAGINKIQGVARYDPSDSTSETVHGQFTVIDEEKYDVDRTQGWIAFDTPFDEHSTLAARYVLKHSDGTADTVGFPSADSSEWYLKLIKPENMPESSDCWSYMWRNVYDLGAYNLQPDEVQIDILRDMPAQEETGHPSGLQYVQIFGLDSLSPDGSKVPDGYVDPIYINYARGELVFPARHPFAPDHWDSILVPPEQYLADTEMVPEIYTSTDQKELKASHLYFIRVKTTSRATYMDLGFGILEGSETVKLNGQKLTRGVDYKIDYTMGRIQFLSERARDPTANITVDYEREPIFMVQQKTLLGGRAKYYLDMNDRSWIGGTGLYRSVAMAEQKPRVGGEPTKNFIWDADFNIIEDLPFLTAAVDALPLITTDAESKLTLQGEYAQIIANPNNQGAAYIDDFEGVKSEMDLGITRVGWHLSSAPKYWEDASRAKMLWYNPEDKVPVHDIWPEKEVAAENSSVDVLTIDFRDTCSAPADTTSWAGIMKYFNPAYHDQRHKQFLEVWVKGDKGLLTVDLGVMSEDINGDGVLQSEDQEIAGVRDGVLTDNEDTGLDGLFDADEPGYNPTTNPDPNGDDWNWTSGDNYEHINGTEGNRNDPAGGKTPDTEDLNNNNYLDTDNDYFSFTIDLSSSDFMVAGTEHNVADGTWRLYRIPIQDSLFTFVEDGKVFHRQEIGDPNWQTIKYARLWLTGLTSDAIVQIASIKLVGSQWNEDFDNFYITEKNTHEDLDYEPPPGVSGQRDYQTGIRAAERSMVMVYNNLPPQDTVYAYYNFTQNQDYTLYNEMSIWLYLPPEYADRAPEFILRFGTNTSQYYEYRATLTSGWVEHTINFADITALKNEYEMAQADTSTYYPIEDNPERVASSGLGIYRIRGKPSLTAINHLEMGIINPNPNYPSSGEVWVDELRLTDPRREPGAARRISATCNLADFMDLNGQYQVMDDDFHSLTQTKGTGYDATTTSLSSTANLQKLTPSALGLTLPVRFNYSWSEQLPRLKSGSDIVLPDSLREPEKNTALTKSVSTNLAIKPPDAPWWVDYSIGAMTFSASYSRNENRKPLAPLSLSENTSLSHRYGLSFGKRKEQKLPLTGFIGDSLPEWLNLDLYYLPTQINFNTSVNEKHTLNINKYYTITNTRTRTLNHTATFGTQPFNSLSQTTTLSMTRNIIDPNTIQLSNPVIIGIPLTKDIKNNVTYKPSFLSFLTQNYTYTSTYSENTDPARRYQTGVFGTANLNRTFRADATLQHTKLIGSPKKAGKKDESGGINLLNGMLNFVRSMKAPRFTYQRDNKGTFTTLAHRPHLSFQFGLAEEPGVPNAEISTGTGTTIQRESHTITESYSASSGGKLPWQTNMDIRYNHTMSRTLAANTTEKRQTTFPDISLSYGKIGSIYPFSKYARSTRASSAYKLERSTQLNNGAQTSATLKHSFAPVFDLSVTWKNGVQTNLKYTKTIGKTTTTRDMSVITWDKDDNYTLSISYSLSAKKGIDIPIFGTLQFENTLKIGVNNTYKHQKKEDEDPSTGQKSPRMDNTHLEIAPNASYKFSRNIDAGAQISFINDNNNTTGIKRRTREVKIWVEIRF